MDNKQILVASFLEGKRPKIFPSSPKYFLSKFVPQNNNTSKYVNAQILRIAQKEALPVESSCVQHACGCGGSVEVLCPPWGPPGGARPAVGSFQGGGDAVESGEAAGLLEEIRRR